ncbi:MAG: biotin/lipoyl-containing protein [Pseudomonadota bacterium]
MDYNLIINDKNIPVNVDLEGEDRFVISVGEKIITVGFDRIGDHLLCLEVNGKKVNTYIADIAEGRAIFFNGKTYLVSDADAVNQSGSRRSGGGKTVDEVTPPMPAVVVAVKVKKGDAVKKGQGVVVVSAMKMETTLFAPFDGTVTKVNVQAGNKVMPGDILVDIQKQEEGAGPE